MTITIALPLSHSRQSNAQHLPTLIPGSKATLGVRCLILGPSQLKKLGDALLMCQVLHLMKTSTSGALLKLRKEERSKIHGDLITLPESDCSSPKANQTHSLRREAANLIIQIFSNHRFRTTIQT
jgi:hypothetical protein